MKQMWSPSLEILRIGTEWFVYINEKRLGRAKPVTIFSDKAPSFDEAVELGKRKMHELKATA